MEYWKQSHISSAKIDDEKSFRIVQQLGPIDYHFCILFDIIKFYPLNIHLFQKKSLDSWFFHICQPQKKISNIYIKHFRLFYCQTDFLWFPIFFHKTPKSRFLNLLKILLYVRQSNVNPFCEIQLYSSFKQAAKTCWKIWPKNKTEKSLKRTFFSTAETVFLMVIFEL